MVWIARGGDEIEVLVKCLSFIILRVNRKRSNPGNVSSLKRAEHRVLKKTGADVLSLPGD